jgi:formylglycine-generating enzyme required for sulfatase activity
MADDDDMKTVRQLRPAQTTVTVGTMLQQRYKVLERLGAGGMGEAWKAADHQRVVDGRPADVVIKLLPEALRQSKEANDDIRKEYSRVWLLAHKHICRLFDMGEQDGVGCFQVMQYLPGITLREWLRTRRGVLLPELVLHILQAAAEALDYAHTADTPVVHRDIKPENIMFHPETRRVHVIDFGLAAEIRNTHSRYSRGQLPNGGTEAYMSPEQWQGREVTAVSDQWALGIVAWELLTGACPFVGSGMALGFAISTAPLPQLPRDLQRLQPVFDRVLHKEPHRRYGTCIEFVQELRVAVAAGSQPQPMATPPASPLAPKPAQRPDPLQAPFTAEVATESQAAWAAYLKRDVQWQDVFGQALRLIPPGEYQMGSDETAEQLEAAGFVLPEERWREWIKADSPRHRVRITKPFYLGVSSVTRGQFAAFVRATGYRTEAETDGKGGWGYVAATKSSAQKPEFTWKNTGFEQTDEHPVVNVTWSDAQAYVKWLNESLKKSGNGGRYRLPREAEWEYACRAGTTRRFFTGDTLESLKGFANVQDESFAKAYPGVDFRKWQKFPFDDGSPFTSPAGRYSSNPFGLYDMLGNVWDWCEDWYDAGFYAKSPLEDPAGPPSGSFRVLRGGSWGNEPFGLRSSYRGCNTPDYCNNYIGCRVLYECG